MLRRGVLTGSIFGASALPTGVNANGAPPNKPMTRDKTDAPVPPMTSDTFVAPPPVPRVDITYATNPLLRDEDKWAGTVKQFKALYGLSVNKAENGENGDQRGTITLDPTSSFQEVIADSSDSGNFHYNQVEMLLNDAADIIERALQSKEQFKDLSARSALLQLEIREFLQNDAIHKDEIAAGIYTLPYTQSLSDIAIQLYKRSGLRLSDSSYGTITDVYLTPERLYSAQSDSELLAWLSYIYPLIARRLLERSCIPLSTA